MFRIPVNDDFFVSFMASVVDINVPLLLGLDVMQRANGEGQPPYTQSQARGEGAPLRSKVRGL